ncbi:MAG: IMP dehydrogenase [Patescibacteria group bacterium]|nr:IMP dehydrogenase [Patescibacteria group bacterium]
MTLVNEVISANMDTVTGVRMAITMAQEGGIGVLHRAVSPQVQAAMVREVKEYSQLRIDNPPKISPNGTVGEVRELMGTT